MARTSLHQFVARVLAEDRILFGDLKRLQRDILPARITSREEAEILLRIDDDALLELGMAPRSAGMSHEGKLADGTSSPVVGS